MSIKLRPSSFYVKDTVTGQYLPQNVIGDVSLDAVRAAMQAEASSYVSSAVSDQIDIANAAVESKGAEQVQAVSDEGASQVAAVTAKGSEVIESLPADYSSVLTTIESCVNGGYVENEVAYFTHDGEVLFEITGIGGGGGDGGGSTSTMTITNTTGWNAASFAKGSDVTLSLTWTSTDGGEPTGDGTMKLYVNNVLRTTRNVAQGSVSINVKEYLSTGSNAVKIIIADSYGNSRQKNFNITVVDMTLTSSFDDTQIQTGDITFPYTPYGEIEKTVHFILDDGTPETVTTSVSGREQRKVFPQQEHGAHSLRVYCTASLNGDTLRSNELYYEFISVEDGETDTIIASSFSQEEAEQYSTVSIPFRVYDPTTQIADVVISIGGNIVAELPDVDRSVQTFSTRLDSTGTYIITIESGTARKDITLTVTGSGIDIHPETENLALFLTSRGRSNAEANPGTWTYETIHAVFSGFNFISNGWVRDTDGVTALRVNGDARLTIPYYIFDGDLRTTGKTIEFEFASRDVRDYSSTLIECMSGGRGLRITAQDCALYSEQSQINTQFKEDEHVRVGFVIDKRNGMRLIRCYLNGVLSGVTQYPSTDDFSQVNPVGITIGSSSSTTDIYNIRVYDNDLNAQQMEDNWIADTADGGLMLERYNHNNIRDAYGNIVTAKLPNDLPYMIIVGAELPQYKGDKKTVEGSYTDPLNPSKSFTFEDAQIDVQGTSSQYYTRKNYKIKFNGGFRDGSGQTASKYKMRNDSIAVKTFTFKADVASSEGANNVELVRLYNDACPYKTPAQTENANVRQGIDGFPIVIFYRNPANNDTVFLGKYNFNNDKSTEEVFGFEEGDESWEIRNNTSNRVIWKSADYSGSDWLNDFEARYPDTDPPYADPAQLAEFAAWIVSTDPAQATGDPFGRTITYGGVNYTRDTADYRKAKFRAELGDYVEVQSALFYYLFTELFLMVDSRAKNAFPSFMGSSTEE